MFTLYKHVPLEGGGKARSWAEQPAPGRGEALGPQCTRGWALTF